MLLILPFILVTYWYIYYNSKENLNLKVLMLGTFTYSILLLFIHLNYQTLGVTNDEEVFQAKAILFSSSDFFTLISSFNPTESYVYAWFIGIVYFFIDQEPVLIRFFGILSSLVIVKYTYKVTLLIWNNKKAAISTTLVVGLLPSFKILSILILRDIHVSMLLLIFFYHYVSWIKSENIKYLFYSILFLLIASLLHGGIFIAIVMVITIEFFRNLYFIKKLIKKKVIKKWQIVFYTIIPMLLVTIVILMFSGLGSSKIRLLVNILSGDNSALLFLAGERVKSTAVTFVYPAPESLNILSLLFHIPERVYYFLFTPSVSMYTKITDLPKIFDTFIVYSMFIIGIFNFKKIFYNSNLKYFMLILSILILMFTFGTFDVQTGQRHRLKFLAEIIIIFLPLLIIKRKGIY